MRLDSRHVDCIWCKRRLIHAGTAVDCAEPFGPRPRSDEHIIPRNIFGKLITTDVCKCCNQKFGELYDFAIMLDHQVVRAAELTGIKLTDLWQGFDGHQYTPEGRKVPVSFRKGTFQPKPQLRDLDKLAVPIVGDKLDEKDLSHFQARLLAKVRAKGLDLGNAEIKKHVEELIDRMRKDSTKPHNDPVIGETVKPTPLDDKIFYTFETKPWETQWCLAKIFFELSHAFWPGSFIVYYAQPLDYCRQFMEKRACSPDGKQGPGIFPLAEELAPEQAARQHTIEGLISPVEMRWQLTFFGTLRWTFRHEVKPSPRVPVAAPRKFNIINRFANPGDDATVEITPLTRTRRHFIGAEWQRSILHRYENELMDGSFMQIHI